VILFVFPLKINSKIKNEYSRANLEYQEGILMIFQRKKLHLTRFEKTIFILGW
jgi:hypothetical protein